MAESINDFESLKQRVQQLEQIVVQQAIDLKNAKSSAIHLEKENTYMQISHKREKEELLAEINTLQHEIDRLSGKHPRSKQTIPKERSPPPRQLADSPRTNSKSRSYQQLDPKMQELQQEQMEIVGTLNNINQQIATGDKQIEDLTNFLNLIDEKLSTGPLDKDQKEKLLFSRSDCQSHINELIASVSELERAHAEYLSKLTVTEKNMKQIAASSSPERGLPPELNRSEGQKKSLVDKTSKNRQTAEEYLVQVENQIGEVKQNMNGLAKEMEYQKQKLEETTDHIKRETLIDVLNTMEKRMNKYREDLRQLSNEYKHAQSRRGKVDSDFNYHSDL